MALLFWVVVGCPEQGLLQYFRLVEGCVHLVHQYEKQAGVSYAWIIRARLDAFWSAPVPPVHTFQAEAYTIPWGSDWGGYNDRFGIGNRRTSNVALKRLSLLHNIQSKTNFKSVTPTLLLPLPLRFCLGLARPNMSGSQPVLALLPMVLAESRSSSLYEDGQRKVEEIAQEVVQSMSSPALQGTLRWHALCGLACSGG